VTDEVLADQVDYYRRRAGEYDVTAYGDVAAARARIARLVAEMGSLLAGNGRVLFIDEHVDEREKEAYVAGRDEVVERRLRDGTTFRVIKNFCRPSGAGIPAAPTGLGLRDPAGRRRLGIWRGASREVARLAPSIGMRDTEGCR
jgi:hypothetical protein